MHKKKHWIVAAGLAVCGLLLAAFSLGHPRDKPGQRAPAGGAGGPRLGRPAGGKKRVLTRLGENAICLKPHI